MYLKGPKLHFNEEKDVDTLVVFMHGYGANGHDLIDIARDFVEVLPNAMFLSPNAPFQFEGRPLPDAYQWGSLRDFSPSALLKELDTVTPMVATYLEEVLTHYNLTSDRLVLVGFSQGAFTALNIALYTKINPRAVIAYSGAFIANPHKEVMHKPALCLVHGDRDDVLAIDNLHEAKKVLTDLKIPTETYVCKGLNHSINLEGIDIGKKFLTNIFGSQ
jgi:phospholipase/carboxylesterase